MFGGHLLTRVVRLNVKGKYQIMKIIRCASVTELGQRAAAHGADAMRAAIAERGAATIVVATGASQFEMMANLVAAPDLDWGRVTAFHLDEYVGMSEEHPASFRRYLRERFIEKLPVPLAAFHPIDGQGDARAECARLNELLAPLAVDVCFAGIGENGHLAFNDPPADFETTAPYIVVDLDEACRAQQMGEGWFATLEAVPKQAISMSIQQIMSAHAVICSVPDERKARAVKTCLQGEVSNRAPASILQTHADAAIYLDPAAAALL